MSKPIVSIGGDYATLHAKHFDAYYGYEIVDKDGNWCFQAQVNDVMITIPSSKLKIDSQYDVVENLLLGIGWVMTKYKLEKVNNDT